MRLTHGPMTRKARKAWPYATVFAVPSSMATDTEYTFWLERPGMDAVMLAPNEALARQNLNQQVRTHLDTVERHWQHLLQQVPNELASAGADRSIRESFTAKFEPRRLSVELPSSDGTEKLYHVDLVHDDELTGDVGSIAQRFAEGWAKKATQNPIKVR